MRFIFVTNQEIVFVTAYDEYALKAFQAHAVDYLTKPINEGHFRKALERIRLLIRAKQEPDYLLRMKELILDVQKRPEFIRRLLVKEKGKLLIIAIEKISVFEAAGDYITLQTTSGKHVIRETLTYLEQKLDPALFIRINRSTIIRINLINELEPVSKGDYQVKLSSGQTYTLSRNYREQVFKNLNKT